MIKGKAKGNQSFMRVIVQRRAFVLLSHRCESASHWSPGLNPFGIYGNKVCGWLSATFSVSVLHSEENKTLHAVFFFYILCCGLKNASKHIFPSPLTSGALNTPHIMHFWYFSWPCDCAACSVISIVGLPVRKKVQLFFYWLIWSCMNPLNDF